MVTSFEFDLLDDLALAVEGGMSPAAVPNGHLRAERLGPLVELAYLRQSGLLGLPGLPAFLESAVSRALARMFGRDHGHFAASGDVAALAITRTPRDSLNEAWVAFCFHAQRAAEKAGIAKSVAQQLIGAIGELEDNIHLHSENPSSGVVAYRAGNAEFEFAVADAGIGVLTSLKRCPEYGSLSDSGQALELVLHEGHSRFGRAANRGMGFRPLFVGLTNLAGYLRFRSDDHVLIMDGRSPTLAIARVHQRARLQGFVISVTCRNPN